MKANYILTILGLTLLSFLSNAQEISLVTDLPYSVEYVGFIKKDNKLFFATSNVFSSKIYRTDGTSAGTEVVYSHNDHIDEMVLAGNKIYFKDNNGGLYHIVVNNGIVTIPEAPELVIPGVGETGVGDMANLNGVLFFEKNSDLWKTDGTIEGTTLVAGFYGIQGLSPVGNKIFFNALDSDQPLAEGHGFELWVSDGTREGTYLVEDSSPGVLNTDPISIVDFNGIAYYSTLSEVDANWGIWRSDGTAAGTYKIYSSLLQVDFFLYPFGGYLLALEAFGPWYSLKQFTPFLFNTIAKDFRK